MPQGLFNIEEHLLIFLLQLSLLLGLARGLGYIFRLMGQPSLIGEILTGVLLGPTILGRAWPMLHAYLFPAEPLQIAMLQTVAWIGILLLLLSAGMEVDVSVAWRQRGDAFKIAVPGVLVPMLIALGPALLLPERYLPAPGQRVLTGVFIATVMAITALPVTIKTLHELNLLKSDLGLLVVSALTINDIMGWAVFTLVLGFATQAALNVSSVAMVIGATLVLVGVCMTAGRRLMGVGIAAIQKGPGADAGLVLTFVCVVGLIVGSVTQAIGIQALLGLFLAGIMAGDAPTLSQRTRAVISQMVHALFVPIFFASIALQIDFASNFDLPLTGLFVVLAILGKFAGAWIGARMTSLTPNDRISVAVAHTPGGAMEMIMALVALNAGLITKNVYVAIVFSALLSSLVVGPWLNWSIRRRRRVNVLDLFLRRAMRLDLAGPTRFDAIDELCQAAAQQDEMPEEALVCQLVRAREEIAGTSIGQGIAVPHARLGQLRRGVVVFGRAPGGIDWDSPDGLPVHLVFMILTPQQQDELQVQILGSIAAALENPQVQQRLLSAKDEPAAWAILREVYTRQQIPAKN
ncbi:MAG: cation:proton antiporter [Planctomycetaceae bacterium]|nr:cation:proton antiporter [Planctomycetaceae bacterium]